MSNDSVKEFQMPKFTLDDQIDWLERNGNDPLDVLTSLRELKRIRERKDLHQNVGCARGQNTTQFCAEAVAAQSKLAKVMDGLRNPTQKMCRVGDETGLLMCSDECSHDHSDRARSLFKAMAAALLRTIEGGEGE